MTLGNKRKLGMRGLKASCLNPNCRHEAVFGVDDYADELEVPPFRPRVKCSKCGGRNVDVRANWKEQPACFVRPLAGGLHLLASEHSLES
jgi:hypothetical protein